jgi:hypothetical protein
VRPRWINDKLVFLEVWWGRIRATDMMLEVERAKWIYMQDADYSGMSLPPCD